MPLSYNNCCHCFAQSDEGRDDTIYCTSCKIGIGRPIESIEAEMDD